MGKKAKVDNSSTTLFIVFSTFRRMKAMQHAYDQIEAACTFLQAQWHAMPRHAIILGTGAQSAIEMLEEVRSVSCADIPYFQPAIVSNKQLRLHCGKWQGLPVLLLDGRYHYYEGCSMWEIGFPIRVFGALGIDTLILTNAAGGLSPKMRKSDLMLIVDHINLQPESPLRGPNMDRYGPRFVDMSEPYDKALRSYVLKQAESCHIPLHQGVYAAVQGPHLETRAEYAYLQTIGADAVGMSTVPEVLIARHMGMRCCALSVISDLCYKGALEEISVSAVLDAVSAAQPHVHALIRGVLTYDLQMSLPST